MARSLGRACVRCGCVGVASYGALEHVPPSTSNCVDVRLLFCCFRFRITQTHCRRHFTFHTRMQARSFVAVYCMNFVMFYASPLNYFLLVFHATPRTKSWRRHCADASVVGLLVRCSCCSHQMLMLMIPETAMHDQSISLDKTVHGASSRAPHHLKLMVHKADTHSRFTRQGGPTV